MPDDHAPYLDPSPATWHDHAKVEESLGRVGGLAYRQAGEEALVEFLPVAPRRVADLGCGDGRLAALVLEHRPDVEEMVAVDRSAPMLAKARERFANDDRVHVIARDLNEGLAPLGEFDLVVSGFAIHHLDDRRKRTLLGEIARHLRPPACSPTSK